MRVVDDVILAALEATDVTVHDSFVAVDTDGKTIQYPLPFLVYYSSLGDDANPRLTGRMGRRSVFFQVTYVGIDRRQAKYAGEKQREALQGQRFTIPGHKAWLCLLEDSQRVRRDDDALRPDGRPLFYGVDQYAISITL